MNVGLKAIFAGSAWEGHKWATTSPAAPRTTQAKHHSLCHRSDASHMRNPQGRTALPAAPETTIPALTTSAAITATARTPTRRTEAATPTVSPIAASLPETAASALAADPRGDAGITDRHVRAQAHKPDARPA